MAEETGGAEAQASGMTDTGGLAVDLAMEEARADPSLRDHVAAFLDDQRRLIAVQKHHLQKQFGLTQWERRLSVLLRAATMCVGLAVAGSLGYMVWDAAQSRGLLVEPFSVPPEFAAKGLTGEAIASQLLDKLAVMQRGTESARASQSYANNWGNDLTVEIPQTGMSIGELRRMLRQWLGHDTRITGEVWRTPTGISMVARASGSEGEAVTGDEANLDALLQKVAENVFRVTQPYRYANYLDRNTFRDGAELRFSDAEKIYRQLIYNANQQERAWAWNGLGTLSWNAHGDVAQAQRYYRKAVEVWPEFPTAWSAIASQALLLGHAEEALDAAKAWTRLARPSFARGQVLAEALGDYSTLLGICATGAERPNSGTVVNRDSYRQCALVALASMHDTKVAREWDRDMPPPEASANNSRRASARIRAMFVLEDWVGIVAFAPKYEELYRTYTPRWDLTVAFERGLYPALAVAKAKLGDLNGAQALIAGTPLDCYRCVLAQAAIADTAQRWQEADRWFARAVRDAPSVPFAYSDWGKSLLARGRPDDAIAQFQLAYQKGPHFADPLEGWGEALIAKNQSHLALAKFAEAEKYAPNWGRLHLKWGEALAYSGNKAEAVKQFARAAQLDLTPTEKQELARHP